VHKVTARETERERGIGRRRETIERLQKEDCKKSVEKTKTTVLPISVPGSGRPIIYTHGIATVCETTE
jgi:hypothetical protein